MVKINVNIVRNGAGRLRIKIEIIEAAHTPKSSRSRDSRIGLYTEDHKGHEGNLESPFRCARSLARPSKICVHSLPVAP